MLSSRLLPLLLLLTVSPACSDDLVEETSSGLSGNPSPTASGSSAGRSDAVGDASTIITRDDSHSRSTLEFDVDFIHLGEMFQQEQKPLAYPFKVVGPDPVSIVDLRPSCGCTEPALEVNGEPWDLGREIPAGAEGRLLAIFSSGEFEQKKGSSITISGTALNMPLQVSLEAFIHKIFEVTPRMVNFRDLLTGDLRQNKHPNRILTVIGAEEFQIQEWVDLPDWLSIKDLGAPEEPDSSMVGDVHRLQITLAEDIPAGKHGTLATAKTTLDKMLTFSVHAEVYGRARYFPDQMVGFNLVEQGKSPLRKLRIQATSQKLDIPIPDFSYEGADVFDISLEEKKPGRNYVLTVELSPDAPIGRHAGTVHLTWPEGAGIEDRDFPVTVLVRKAR